MKKIDEKAFKMLKIIIFLAIFVTCGLYYVLFVKNDFEKPMETINYVKAKGTKNDEVDVTKATNKHLDNDDSISDYIIDIEPFAELSTVSTASNIVENNNALKDIADEKVDINSATSEELQTLKNIGPVVASNIISYREENGKFVSIEDIKNVKGIGDAKFNSIKENIYAG